MTLPGLLLFARTPAAGKVKTRLAPPLSQAEVLALYLAFLEDASRVYCRPERWRAILEADPDPDDPALATRFPAPWSRRRQAQGDLGERLSAAFEREFASGAPAALAVGSDHPSLERRLIEEAFDAIEAGARAAVIPARDGGYCAIALDSGVSPRRIFSGIPWSTPSVLAATRERFVSLGLPAAFLEESYDVDRPEDLELLREDLARRDPAGADYPEATARALGILAAAR
jgi:rSAM/selenodomain-associated transferase 1